MRWDPDRENIIHFEQSAFLYYSYHYVTLFLNQPFSNASHDALGHRQPSAERCMEAQACIRLVSIASSRTIVNSHGCFVTLLSGAVLLTTIWTTRSQYPSADVSELVRGVQRCLSILRAAARPWRNYLESADHCVDPSPLKDRWTAANRHLFVLLPFAE